MAQGDTTTVMAASMCAFYLNIDFAHVEAGLRSFDLEHPFRRNSIDGSQGLLRNITLLQQSER